MKLKIIKPENKVPSKLYHLTTLQKWGKIKKQGLRPNKSQSSLEGVFLTDDLFTAKNYSNMEHPKESPDDSGFIILTINGNLLNPEKIVADNYDFPDLVSQMSERQAAKYDLNSWQDSLKVCNQIAYEEIIPPNWIINHTIYDPNEEE